MSEMMYIFLSDLFSQVLHFQYKYYLGNLISNWQTNYEIQNFYLQNIYELLE